MALMTLPPAKPVKRVTFSSVLIFDLAFRSCSISDKWCDSFATFFYQISFHSEEKDYHSHNASSATNIQSISLFSRLATTSLEVELKESARKSRSISV